MPGRPWAWMSARHRLSLGQSGSPRNEQGDCGFLPPGAGGGCPYQHIHATGSYGWRWMPEYVKERGVDLPGCSGLEMVEYIYDMPTWMAAADLIIGRAGASTLNEIAASGTPCIIVPSPNVTDNHQEKNARVLADRGAAQIIHEADCTGQALFRRRRSCSMTLQGAGPCAGRC